MKKYTRNDIKHVWYDIDRMEVNIELENGAFEVVECYDIDAMYRNFDRAEWCLEHDAPFYVKDGMVIISWI